MAKEVDRVEPEAVEVEDSGNASPVAVDIVAHSPAGGGVVAPGEYIGGSPNAEVVFDNSVLLGQSIAHGIESLGGLGGGPVIAIRSQVRVEVGGASAVVVGLGIIRVAEEVLVLPIVRNVAVVVLEVVNSPRSEGRGISVLIT